ncbi:MAG: DNA polymerase III subunit gamma/tau [Rickettsiales bacterium]|nr:DNA polymerase III subunit gamma/tau [Rickettsiales bacterium]
MKHQEYKVLARKYRPQKFADLIGQESLVNILSNAILKNRIAHAYLLTGVRGVGKTTTARLIAMSLNCQKRESQNYEPCGECESCLSIRQDRNLDVIEMDAASKTGVDDIREIIDNVKYKPVNSSFKIFMIDEVHMLSKNAFNALLKTLEEPPEHVKFIFATTEVKKIPITILSRCQRFDLNRVENKVLTNHLIKISEFEKIKLEQDATALIVRAADGSVRDSLSLLDQAIVNQNDVIIAKDIANMLGLADRGKIFDLLDSIFKGDATKSLELYNELYKSGADIVMIFDEMLNAVHFITQVKIAPDLKNDIYIPELERIRGSELGLKLSMASLGLFWQVLFKGYQELQGGLHLHQLGEMIILRLIYLHDGPSPEELLNKTKTQNIETSNKISREKSIDTESINRPQTINKEKKIEKNVDKDKDNSKSFPKSINSFRGFVELFYSQKEGMLHSQLYNNVKLVSFKEGELVLNTDTIKDPHFNRTIAKLISKWTGRIWQIQSSTSNLGKSLYEDDLIQQQKDIKKMKEHPDIKNILKSLPGVTIHSITEITEINEDNNLEKKNIKEKEV